MAVILEEFPEIRQTFNLVPSLIEQIIEYTEHHASDRFLEVTIKSAGDLDEKERIFILEHFFLANWETMVKPFPRYHKLLSKRGFRFLKGDLQRTIRYFSVNEFRDLQVLFNLAWIDPFFREEDPLLRQLSMKGGDYTEEEKHLLMESQLSILRKIIPKYRELSRKGQIELSTTPFYHPILPLLWDTEISRLSTPDIRLPKRRFSFPEDGKAQIRKSLDFFERTFGYRPLGMWPSEGSVSKDAAMGIRAEGVQWIATDEDILARSLKESLRGSSGEVLHPELLYSAYEFSGLSMVFRDHRISDLLGFTYAGWEPKSAADDLIRRLLDIHAVLPHREPYLVSIILDGENAWEYYRNDGRDFLRYLYEGLSRQERIESTTVGSFLNHHQARRTLGHLHAGSWISANFDVWIGHEEDNRAWDYLTEAREFIGAFQKRHPERDLESAWKALYVAEGSDWNWWYGDDHVTELAHDFDELFRLNLMKVYRETGADVPPHLYVPIFSEDRAIVPSVEIRGFIHPKIDGVMTSYFEWYQGAYLDVERSGGSMHMTESLISRIYYGFNKDNLFLRIDPRVPFTKFPDRSGIMIDFLRPSQFRVDILLQKETKATLLSRSDDEWGEVKEIHGVAIGDILEIEIPFGDIVAKEHDDLDICISIGREGAEIERCPWRGYITVTVPSPDFEAMMWY